MIDISNAKQMFDKYVNTFDMSNKMIKDKYYHTYRVCELSLEIARSLDLNEEDSSLVYLIALLHDIGRFSQVKIYNTFDDLKSVDHAYLGYKILFEDGLIREFVIDEKYDNFIKKAILNHNKYEIESGLTEKELLFSKVIRDADKLDIIYNIIHFNNIVFSSDNSVISSDMVDCFKNKKPIKVKLNTTKNESILIRLAFLFDYNFLYSYKYYKEHDLINKMYSKINNKDLFKEYIDILNNYLEYKLNKIY